MKLPILYSFRRCPYAIRARMALAKAQIKCEHREVSLKNKPSEMLSLSSKGTVPVLELIDGTVIDESLDVMLWALDKCDPEQWLNADMEETLSLIYKNDFEFKVQLDKYKYHVRHPQHTQEELRDTAKQFLKQLNEQLSNNQGEGLVTKGASLADVAIFPFIRQFAGVDREWFDTSEHAYLIDWLANWEASQDIVDIMQKYEYWNAGG